MAAGRSTRLQNRIITFYSLLLVGVLAVTVGVVTLASYRIADRQVGEEILVGERVFRQLLVQQQQQLVQSATVLTADFGFLEVVSIDDPATVLSALINHSRRVDADLMVLFDLDQQVISHTLSNRHDAVFTQLALLFGATVNYSSVSDVVKIKDHLYQVVLVPVMAPEPIAWVAIGFLIDSRFANRLKDITGLEVSFLADDKLVISTLPEKSGHDLESISATEDLMAGVPHDIAGYSTLFYRVSAAPGTRNFAVLQQSPLMIMAQFTQLQMTLAAVSLLALAVTVIGSVLIARRITQPINRLAEAADRIESGDYDVHIIVESDDELGRLGTSLQHMVAAVADREEKIKRLAFEDMLTGLPNRALFVREVGQFIPISRRNKTPFSIIFIELDRFKQVNETLGYEAGDIVLKHVAGRLPSCFRDSDTIACFGGNDFAVLLTMNTPEQIKIVTNRIESTFADPFMLGDQPIDLNFSIGISHYPDHAQDAESLLRKADVALQKAKQTRAGIATYNDEQEQSRQEYLHLLGELRQAVSQNQLVLHYQPKLHIASGKATAAEALVRWIHPVRGMVPPGLFIPFAEHTGAIRMVTNWVITSVLAQLRDWQRAGIDLQVSLNVSTRDLLNKDLPAFLAHELRANAIAPDRLCIEITESALMEDPETAMTTVMQLAELGLELAIDDYGTGYSSLAYLKNLPVRELKIDREFIVNMSTQEQDRAIVESTIELGHNLNLKLVAEGVESQAEFEILATLGCDFIQGYHVAKPMPASELEAWLSAGGYPSTT